MKQRKACFYCASASLFGPLPLSLEEIHVLVSSLSLFFFLFSRGQTLRGKETLPEHVLADEHHIRVQGQKAYVTTTVGKNCILGVQAVDKADTETLKAGLKPSRKKPKP